MENVLWGGKVYNNKNFKLMIRFTFKFLKPVVIFLAIAVLFQCCKVYYKEPITIDKAIGDNKKRVKIITTDNRKWIFESIYYKDDGLYGILLEPVKNFEKTEVLIDENNILKIFLCDIKKSRRNTILIIVSIPITIGLVFLIGSWIAIS